MMEEATGRSVFETARNARREKGLTQSEVALAVGCKQSAVSMFENGRVDALSRKHIATLGEKIGIDLGVLLGSGAGGSGVGATVGMQDKYCPNGGCPSNVPYAVNGEICLKPMMIKRATGEKTRCAFCGELLEDKCPNEQCGAFLNEGAFCTRCGSKYVVFAGDAGPEPEAWADRQRERIRELLEMTETRQVSRR